MTILAYTGLPRSGKSYSVVEHVIIPMLKAGRPIYHNMKLNTERLMELSEGKGELHAIPATISPAELVKLIPPGAVIVLDEMWRYWPAGMKASAVPKDEMEFFTMHGHRVGQDGFTTEIVLITQDLSQIASWARVLVEQTFRTTKLSAVGQETKFRVDMYSGAVTGQSPPAGRLVRQTYGSYRKEIYDCYVSHTQSTTGTAGKEDRVDKRAAVFKGMRFKAALVALLVVPLGAGLVLHSFHAMAGKGAEPKAERSEAAGQRPPAAQAVQPVTPRWSTSWRLSGRIRHGLDDYYVVDGDHGGRLIEHHHCHRDSATNVICEVDGELVAEWTGPKPGFIESTVGRSLGGERIAN